MPLPRFLGIYRALHTLFSSETSADARIKKPNSAQLFGGAPALQVIKGWVTGLRSVRAYFEAVVMGGTPPPGR